jgi:uncharacterized protein YigE (DUF2233 family)
MRQVYHVISKKHEEWNYDPQKGPALVIREAIEPSGATRIQYTDGRNFEVQPDGTFHLPDEVAAYFLRMPGWHEGAKNPFVDPPPAPTGPKVRRVAGGV